MIMTRMEDPIRDWLAARLRRASAPPEDIQKESLALGITFKELDAARSELCVELQNGLWVLPGASKLRQSSTLAQVVPRKPDPKDRVRRAKERLANHSVRHVRYLEELAEYAARDPQKCPTCGRGTPRAESIRLQAILAALGMAGVPPGKNDLPGEEQQAPALVFPPGTRIAVLAETPPSGAPGVSRPGPSPEVQAVRADHV